MPFTASLRLSTVSLLAALSAACSAAGGHGPGAPERAGKADGPGTASAACENLGSYPDRVLSDHLGVAEDQFLHNFTAWPEYDPRTPWVEVPADVVAPIADKDAAREMLASRFPSCEESVLEHFDQQPDVYVYFEGYGGPQQNNSRLFSPAILRWVNERDPEALIFAINWNCGAEPDSFCKGNAEAMQLGEDDPAFQRMQAVLGGAGIPAEAFLGAAAGGSGEGSQGRGYDEAMSHAMHLAARLVDQLLVAGLGDIHFIGYSMGAQAAAQVLIQDFSGEGKGFSWTREDACVGGGSECTVAELDQVKWSLSLGLPGWSEAMRAYRRAKAEQGPDASRRQQYENGGLLRIADERFRNKLNVFNRRMDPTSNSDDVFYRSLGDSYFGEYNHYSHDYALPLFIDREFVRSLDRFLSAEDPADVPEMGIYFDNAGLVTFDDCADGGPCEAGTGYYAHDQNRSHQKVDVPRTTPVATVPGVGAEGRAVTFAEGASEPIALHTFDQEDLRGGVELQFRPRFRSDDRALHGLFSYGDCAGSDEDLMPEAFIENGRLVFAMRYQGTVYEASVDVADRLTPGEFTHLAFTWELPTVSLSHEEDPDPSFGLPLAVAAGLMRPLPTSYRAQAGEGELRIFVDGRLESVAPLGTVDSARDCLPSSEVLSEDDYEVNGALYAPYSPYANYGIGSDRVHIEGQSGPLCKVNRVRNVRAFFGCARSEGQANAEGDMDDIVLLWGPGRESYDNLDADGSPRPWVD